MNTAYILNRKIEEMESDKATKDFYDGILSRIENSPDVPEGMTWGDALQLGAYNVIWNRIKDSSDLPEGRMLGEIYAKEDEVILERVTEEVPVEHAEHIEEETETVHA